MDPSPNSDPRVSPCTGIRLFAVTCLQVNYAHATAGIFAAQAEDDEDSEDGKGNTSPDHNTSNPIGGRRSNDSDDLLNSSASGDKNAANSLHLVAKRSPGPCAAGAVLHDYAQTVEDIGRLVCDQDLLWIRVWVALRALESLDDCNSRASGWLERLTPTKCLETCVNCVQNCVTPLFTPLEVQLKKKKKNVTPHSSEMQR